MSSKSYKNLVLEPSLVADALESFGAEGLTQTTLNDGKLVQHGGIYNGQRFLVQIFINSKGKCTIGGSTGYDTSTFDVLTMEISRACAIGSVVPLNVSIPRFTLENLQMLLEFLTGQDAVIDTDEAAGNYRLLRLSGKRGDKLTLKQFNNGTLQMQGVHAHLAALALDFVQTVLPLDQILAHQKSVYEVPLTIEQIKRDLEARIPHVHDSLDDRVRIQLSSALAMTKVGIELEDYSPIAFPALRGLEGYVFALLSHEVGLDLASIAKLGDYFKKLGMNYRLLSLYRKTASLVVQDRLASCYKLWHNNRHRLFHMDGTPEFTRILDTRAEAVAIVNEVLNTIEESFLAIQRSKGSL